MTLPTDVVFEDIRAERDRHTAIGYDARHDEQHGVDHLVIFAKHYIARGTSRMYDQPARRAELVKAASMLAAAVELMDRAE